MFLREGNMWDEFAHSDLFLITTNSTVKMNGTLVMGRGIAAQAKVRFPGLDKQLGSWITNMNLRDSIYGLAVSGMWPNKKLGMFQVKTAWQGSADLRIINKSAEMLEKWCATQAFGSELFPTGRPIVNMNFPGIGNGRLEYRRVLPLLKRLPDNVHIWTGTRA